MRTTIAALNSRAQPQTVDFGVLETEVTRLLTSHGRHEARGAASQEIRDLRKNVRRRVNRCVPTLLALLRAAGPATVREFCVTLLGTLAPFPVPQSETERYLLETSLEGRINDFQAGEHSCGLDARQRAQYVEVLEEYAAILPAWIAYERELLARQRRTIA